MEKLMTRTVLTKFGFLCSALAVGVGIPFLIGASVYAQDLAPASQEVGAVPAPAPPPGAGGEAVTERIIVTGSNIPTAEEVGPNPVLSINRDLINKTGERNTEQLIRNLPIAGPQGVQVSNNAVGFTPGASTVALRAFDPRATLILIDGRRVAPYPIGIVGIVFVDLNSIPRAAIQSIEILKDGASTTYGADAVAGVVNIKLRHDYHGAEATVEYGNTLDKDSSEYSASLLFGVGDGDTNVTGVMNFYHRNSIANRDRGFSNRPPFLSTNSSPENLNVTFEAVVAAGGTPPAGTAPGDLFFAHAPFGSNGSTPASDFVYSTGRTSLFNFNAFSLSFPEQERWGGYVAGDHKIFGDQMVGYADLMYQDVKTHNELAPGATGNFQTAGQVTIAIPPHDPNAPLLGGPTAAEVGLAPGAFNPFNPFQQIISGASRARLAEFGNRLYDNETDAFLTTIGVRGDKLFDGTWGYDAGFRYSQLKNTSLAQSVSATNYNRILNQNDPIFDPTSSQFIGTTVAYNPFGDFRVPIAANSGAINFATIHTFEEDTSKLATLDFNIYTTELFKLPAGGVGFAFGGQFRRESFDENPDAASIAGDAIGNGARTITVGGRKSFAFYAETSVPIFSPANSIPGFYALEFTGAGRFEDFRNNDTNVMVPKVGARWQPFDESLTIRATWGEGFREPSLEELFAGPIQNLAPTLDPLTGVAEPETPVLVKSNPNLTPEDSRSFSGGLVYTPKFVPGLTLSVDFWDIQRTGEVFTPTPDQVLAREAAGALLPGEVVERNADGNISRITLVNQNSGYEEARGVDFGLQYQIQTPYGTFTSLTQASYLDRYAQQLVVGGVTVNLRGDVQGPGGAQPEDAYLKWKGDSRLDWAWNGFDLNTTVRYTDGFHEHKSNGITPHWVHQTWFIDVQGSYDFTFVAPVENAPVAGYSKDAKEMVRGKDGKATETAATQTATYGLPIWKRILNGTSITVGCNDVFGQDPPDAFNSGGNTDGYPGAIYDATGRFVYVSLTKKF
jgi:iron complex outermembrane recepter protein